jgi:dihydrodipicolinate synthase/N-acetylneuraminate lyase
MDHSPFMSHTGALTPPSASSERSDATPPHGERLPNGVYVPILAFFTSDDTIDVPATQRHVARLLAAGIAGIIVHGSNGEAAHLSRRERRIAIEAVVDAARHAADPPNERLPIIAGCGAESVRETVELCCEAQQAGATHALILPPGYYAGLMGVDELVGFFHQVADRSPLPVLIYNYPGAAHGVDLNSDTILRIAAHPRIVGIKLTCGNTGKLARVVADVPKVRDGRDDFFVGGGSADFLLQSLAVGAHGTIAGFANLAPRACVRVMELFEQGRLKEARELQAEVARADWLAIRYGFVGVKAAMPMFHGEAERAACEPRRPLKRLPQGGKAETEIFEGMAGAMVIERQLESTMTAA